jgi:hypothetical protein
MTTHFTRFLVFLFSALVATACSATASDGSVDEGTADLSVSKARALCTDFWRARSDEFLACSPELFAAYYTSKDDYVAQKTESCVAAYTSHASGAQAADLKACFDAYGHLSCPDFVRFTNEANPPQPDACAPLLKGKRADGESCAFDAECAGGDCDKSGPCGTCAT